METDYTTYAPIASVTMVKHGLMALFGAVANALRAHRSGTSKGLADFIFLTVMSSFSGVVFSLVAHVTLGDTYLTLAAAGAGGFLGVEALSVMSERIRDSIVDTFKKR